MSISGNFVPTDFDILDFYGEETCFAWCNDKLVVFPYVKSAATCPSSAIVAPRKIRCVRSFDSRVFILCEPVGIYKLMKIHKFSTLSSTGIANGPAYYEVFTPQNNWLHSQNKLTKVNRPLFQLNSSSSGSYNLRDITLDKKNSESSLRQAVSLSDEDRNEDICILTYKKKVFMITQNEIQIIHQSEDEIIKITPILRGKTIDGVVFVTINAAILVFVSNGKLIFHKVHLDGEVRDLCAGISINSDNAMWLAHIDGAKIYYWTKTTSDKTFHKVKTENAKLLSIKNYKNESLIGLSHMGHLINFTMDFLELGRRENEEFIKLKSDMFNGSEKIVNAICEKAKELQHWNELLLGEQDKLKRINIYSHKQKIVYLPDVCVERIAGRLFARIKFENVLPFNCYIVVGLMSNERVTYCIKVIEDSDMTLDLCLLDEKFNDKTTIRIDLVTLLEPSKAWCLIRNYTINPKLQVHQRISKERIQFLNAKLEALRNLTNEDGSMMPKLSAIKKSIRRELKNL